MGWVTLSFRGTTLLAKQHKIEKELMDVNHELLSIQNEIAAFASTNPRHHCCHHGVTNPYMNAKMQTDLFIKQNAYYDSKTNQYYTFHNKKPIKFNPQEHFMRILQHETKKYMRYMMNFMHKKEADIMQKKQKLEMELQLVKAEKQQVDSAKQAAIQASAPRYS